MEDIRILNSKDYEDFKKVFQMFEREPFYEAWEEADYIQEFIDFIEHGKMYGIYIENEICGLITIKEKYKKWDELDLDIEKSIYLSDIVVRRNSRNRGYATKLMKYIISKYGNQYDIYMRTNLENSMSEGIARKNGFEIINGKIQTVSFKRTRPDIPETDQRKYLIRKKMQ